MIRILDNVNAILLGPVARKVDNFIQRIVIFSIAGERHYTKDIDLASVKKCLSLENNDFLSGL